MKWPALFASALLAPSLAYGDPCEGRLPSREGETFSGEVRYVVDGDGLCVGPSADPLTWIEVRLVDFNAPELRAPGGREAKSALERLAMHAAADCVARRGRNRRVRSHDRVVAECSIRGRRLGDALRAEGVREGGN